MSWLKRIFGSEQPSADLSQLKTDIHSHLIPGIDDGATDLENSIQLIEGLKALGYSKLITTPHIMSDFYRNTPEIIREGLGKVRAELKQRNIEIEIEAAAEYYCDTDFERSIDDRELLTLGGKYILVEVSYLNPTDNFDSVIFKLQSRGYTPILAHPERYPYWYHSFDKYHQLHDKGVVLQLNLASVTGHYGTGPKRIAERLIDNNLITLLGTDIHKMSHHDVYQRALKEPMLHRLLDSGQLMNSYI